MMVRKRHETNPETYAKYYLDQQSGNGTSKYVASHYRQRGYGIGSVLMSKLWNLAKPLIRSAAPVAASVGKKVISDVASGRSLKDATINRVREAGGGMIQQSKVNHARGRGGSSSKRGSSMRGHPCHNSLLYIYVYSIIHICIIDYTYMYIKYIYV